MDIIELAIQGVRKFNTSLKFTIKDGYNVFFGPNGCGKTTLFETILALLDKKFCDEKSKSFLPWDTAGSPSRAGIVFKVGADTLRIIKDFANSTTILSREIGGGKFEPLSREADWIHDHLTGTLGLPGGEILKELLLSSSLEYEKFKMIQKIETPEQIDTGEANLVEDTNNYELSDRVYYSSGDYDEETAIKKRIEQLEEELMLVEQINQIQFQVDGLESQMFEIESKLKEIKIIDEKIASIDKELEKYKTVEALPPGTDAKVRALKEQEEAKNKELFGLQKEVQYAKQELSKYTGIKFYNHKPFIAGIITSFPFLIAQFVLTVTTDNPLISTVTKFFPLVWITGFGLLLYTAWIEIARRDKEKKAEKRLKDAQERIKTIEKKYEVEALLLKNLLQQANLKSSEDLMDALENIKILKEEKRHLEEEKNALRAKYNLDALLKQKAELQKTIKENEARLLEVGGFSNDPNEIRKEIERLRATLSPQKKPEKKQSEKKAPVSKTAGIKSETFVSLSQGSPLKHLLRLAAEATKKNDSELMGLSEEMLSGNLSQISGGTFTGIHLREKNELLPVAKDGREYKWEELSPSSREAVYYAFKLTMLYKLIEFNPLPVILDEPFIFSDDTRLIEFAKLLRKIGEKTKIIHFTSKPIFAKAGVQVYNLKGIGA